MLAYQLGVPQGIIWRVRRHYALLVLQQIGRGDVACTDFVSAWRHRRRMEDAAARARWRAERRVQPGTALGGAGTMVVQL